jgi:predicted transcriptional regulator
MVEESQITVQACLKDERLMAFVTALLSRGLLQEGEDGRFKTTDEGRRYVEGFRELSGDLDELASIEDSSSQVRPKILRRYK